MNSMPAQVRRSAAGGAQQRRANRAGRQQGRAATSRPDERDAAGHGSPGGRRTPMYRCKAEQGDDGGQGHAGGAQVVCLRQERRAQRVSCKLAFSHVSAEGHAPQDQQIVQEEKHPCRLAPPPKPRRAKPALPSPLRRPGALLIGVPKETAARREARRDRARGGRRSWSSWASRWPWKAARATRRTSATTPTAPPAPRSCHRGRTLGARGHRLQGARPSPQEVA